MRTKWVKVNVESVTSCSNAKCDDKCARNRATNAYPVNCPPVKDCPKIESNIPVPEIRRAYGMIATLLHSMRKGDSVLVLNCNVQNWRTQAYKHEVKILGRKVSASHTRIWCIG